MASMTKNCGGVMEMAQSIGALQALKAEVLRNAAEMVEGIEVQISDATAALMNAASRGPDEAAVVGRAIESYKVNMDELNYRFADALGERGVIPQQAGVTKPKWAIVRA